MTDELWYLASTTGTLVQPGSSRVRLEIGVERQKRSRRDRDWTQYRSETDNNSQPTTNNNNKEKIPYK